MTKLAELFNKFEENTKIGSMDINEIHQFTRPAWGKKIAEAKDSAKTLKAEYRTELLANAVAIFLQGPSDKVEEFQALVLAEKEGVTASATELYECLTAAAEAVTTQTRQWTIAQTQRVLAELQSIMREIGTNVIAAPKWPIGTPVPTHQDTYNLVKSFIQKDPENSLNRLYVEHQALETALQMSYTNTVVPVVVSGALTDEYSSLSASFGKNYVEVKIDETDVIDKDFLVKTFKTANKKMQKTKQPATDLL